MLCCPRHLFWLPLFMPQLGKVFFSYCFPLLMLVLVFEGQSPLLCCSHPLRRVPTTTDAPATTTLFRPRPLHAVHLAMSRPQPPCPSVEWVFFFVFVLPSLTCIRAHSLSSFPVPHPLMCYTPRHHPFPLPPCQHSRHPVWCINAPAIFTIDYNMYIYIFWLD